MFLLIHVDRLSGERLDHLSAGPRVGGRRGRHKVTAARECHRNQQLILQMPAHRDVRLEKHRSFICRDLRH